MSSFDGNFAAGEDHSLEESVGRAHRGEDRLILIRHGQTHANIARILDTALPGAPLTDHGIIQARRLGRVLLPSWDRMTEIVTSQALRARQTGAGAVAGLHHLTGPGVRLRHESGLHEVQAGEVEGRSDYDAHRQFMEVFHGWLHGNFGAKVPGGESADDVLARYLPVLRMLVDEAHESGAVGSEGDAGRNIVVVSHGAAIRLIAQHLGDIDGQFIFDNPLPNAARVELVRDVDAGDGDRAGSWRLARWGELSDEREAE
ncbi:histidine phosphatase family protein [uncultured Corynebacterium sp.]|uniref:histidine phosphatase family protein n=1 Tax=uncultured Corynebacterium sp. TaxID=159447 RepID=UPI0025E5E5ED|nr:histidine phosphatase family protein [uncultured Corynebacterium sp.]